MTEAHPTFVASLFIGIEQRRFYFNVILYTFDQWLTALLTLLFTPKLPYDLLLNQSDRRSPPGPGRAPAPSCRAQGCRSFPLFCTLLYCNFAKEHGTETSIGPLTRTQVVARMRAAFAFDTVKENRKERPDTEAVLGKLARQFVSYHACDCIATRRSKSALAPFDGLLCFKL